MTITYTAPNRAHHYQYAKWLNDAGHLHAFISGFSRFSPRSALPSIGNKLKRHDFFQNLYVASLRAKSPYFIERHLNKFSNISLDKASFSYAKDSQVFIHYRTQGFNTTKKLRSKGFETICVMEEVNSHIEFAEEILRDEYKKLKIKSSFKRDADYSLRVNAYESADFILCPSEFVKKSFVQKGFSESKLIKVNFGFSPVVDIKDPGNFDLTEFRMLFVGQVNYRKGLGYAIEAFKKLKHHNKKFIIVGPITSITGLERINIPKEVEFTGPLKGQALQEQYKKASVFVLPSLEEGLALVQGEALGYGIPIVITTNTGGSDIIKNGVEGFIVEPRDVHEMALRLQELADDIELRRSMSISAYNTSKQLGGWDTAINNLVIQLKSKLKIRHQ